MYNCIYLFNKFFKFFFLFRSLLASKLRILSRSDDFFRFASRLVIVSVHFVCTSCRSTCLRIVVASRCRRGRKRRLANGENRPERKTKFQWNGWLSNCDDGPPPPTGRATDFRAIFGVPSPTKSKGSVIGSLYG